jgi:hypothetical protein
LKKIALITLALNAAAFVFGQPASMTLTGGGNNVFNDVYIGPYTALINGVSTEVICDDYYNETYLYESWTATETTVGSSVTTAFGPANSQQYDEVAWLAEQLMNPSTTCAFTPTNCAADIQYALWDVFDPSASTGITGNDQQNIASWLSAAQTQTYSVGEFSNVDIYTPTGFNPASPQEFIAVNPVPSPEPPSVAVLGLDFGGLAGLIFVVSRFRKARA